MRKIEFTDLKAQYAALKPLIDKRIQRVLDHGQYIMGPEVRELETRLEEFTGAGHCITVASGTEALLIALMALDVKPGDEIITTPFSFVATVEVIVLLGAVPVMVDIEPGTCNIDASRIENAITPETRAILPVSLYGQPADMAEINAIAARHGLTVIEDGAQSFGASYKEKRSCNLSTIGCTSFFPSKPLGCYGDGGALFTSDPTLAQAMREIRVHGQQRRYRHTRIGVGGRMDTLQCAVVLAKLETFDRDVGHLMQAGDRYRELMKDIPDIEQLTVKPDRTCVYAQFTILTDNRDAIQRRLKAAGVPSAIHYPLPLHHQPAYQSACRISGTLGHAEAAATRVISLPMHPYIEIDVQQQVVNALMG